MGKTWKQQKPKSASWRTAKLFAVDLYISRLPVCGGRFCFAVVGRKHVRLCEAGSNIKMKIRRAEWDTLGKREIAV